MIHSHCNKVLWRIGENKFYFRRKCQVCGKIFTQRKRLPKGVSR